MRWLGDFVGDWFAQWFGAGEAAPPGALSASLSGTGDLAGTLEATGAAVPAPGGGLFIRWVRAIMTGPEIRRISARLVGRATVRATLSITPWTETTEGREEEELIEVGFY